MSARTDSMCGSKPHDRATLSHRATPRIPSHRATPRIPSHRATSRTPSHRAKLGIPPLIHSDLQHDGTELHCKQQPRSLQSIIEEKKSTGYGYITTHRSSIQSTRFHEKPTNCTNGSYVLQYSDELTRCSRDRVFDALANNQLDSCPPGVDATDTAPDETPNADARKRHSSVRVSHDMSSLPSRDSLLDQLEWDMGIAETLFRFKRWQIQEQIDVDSRCKRNGVRNTVHNMSLYQRLKLLAIKRLPRTLSNKIQVDDKYKTHNERRLSQCNALHVSANRQCRKSSAHITKSTQSCDGQCSTTFDPTFLTGRRPSLRNVEKDCTPLEYRIANEMRSKSQRALFEGLANTADMSKDRWFILHPNSTTRHVWTNFVALATAAAVVVSPLVACQVYDQRTIELDVVHIVIDITFATDVLLQFVTAYQDPLRDIIVTCPSHIIKRYVTSMFLYDLLSALPIDWIAQLADQSTNNASFYRLLKLSRFYHLIVTDDVHLNLGDTSVNPSVISLIKMTSALGIFWHMTACLYNFLSVRHFVEDTTLVFNTTFSLQTNLEMGSQWHMPRDVWVHGPVARYLYAFSWAIAVTSQTMRPTANDYTQLVVGDIVSLSGLFFMTAIIGAATAAIAELQAQRSETTRILQRIAQYMQHKRIPRDLRRRVLAYYRFHRSSMNILENEDVLVGLPQAMRMQISLLMHKSIFVKLPLFWLCSEDEMLLIVQRLRPCLIMPGEMMLKEGTIGVGLFLLMKGAVETTINSELLVVILAVAAFGEAALQSDNPSDVSIRALRFCETSILMREDWAVVEQLNPKIRIWLDIYVAERDRKIRDPLVKTQSHQTRKATIRSANNGGYRDWKDVINPESQTETMENPFYTRTVQLLHALKIKSARPGVTNCDPGTSKQTATRHSHSKQVSEEFHHIIKPARNSANMNISSEMKLCATADDDASERRESEQFAGLRCIPGRICGGATQSQTTWSTRA